MAAARKQSTADVCHSILSELQAGKVAPVYLLMGAESYYIDKVSEWIQNNLLNEDEKDFNLSIVYGSDNTTNAQQIADNARRYPIMAERQVLIVRDAQGLKNLEPLEKYIFSYKEVKKSKTKSYSKDGMSVIQVELNDNLTNKDEFWSKFKHGVCGLGGLDPEVVEGY